jgi:hypothetical protein
MKTLCVALLFILPIFLIGCSTNDKNSTEEEISLRGDTVDTDIDTAASNTLDGNLSLSQIVTYPHRVIKTGLRDQRLISIYRLVPRRKENFVERYSDDMYGTSYNEYNNDWEMHYMPGIDLIFGYNLVNIAHYNFATEKTALLFDHPVLIRSLYYPSFVQDSLDKKPINRDYFFVSVYNEDTNKDTVINKVDLRRFIYFNADASQHFSILPPDYSVARSQYDAKRDVMYLFARHDANQNGKDESSDPMHVFWISLARPEPAKRMY